MSAPASDSHDLTIHKSPPSTATLLAQRLPKPYINSFCGAAAGVASGIVTCPLDVIKTKLQAQGSFRHQQHLQGSPSTTQVYRGLVGTARTIVRQDGLKGMYRGLGPMILGYLPTWAVYMSIYDIAKSSYLERIEPQWFAHVCSSVTAGACSTLATNPIWVIKTRLMSQISTKAVEGHRTPWHYNNTWDAARQMYKGEGIKAFYSGLAPALLGLTHVAIQFPLYEFLKLKFTGVEMGAAPSSQGTNSVGVLAATCISKICATTATYPHEVLRTRLQTQQRGIPSSDGMINKPRYQGVLKTCRLILYEEGWRAFYSGMGTNLIRAVPAAMTTMLTFETLKSVIVRMQAEDEQGHPQPL
ncbi:hypothetical protein D6C91_02381 [Aureobasidium pullulans]|uniref:Mitochondrial carrier n=1 Tax=Aureobasidium pullulans TaxID=5580 RepID=A0A4S9TRU0_AURPU|nr:hypothetical protein D6C91_02381 [Aureobasidium pullulans]